MDLSAGRLRLFCFQGISHPRGSQSIESKRRVVFFPDYFILHVNP